MALESKVKSLNLKRFKNLKSKSRSEVHNKSNRSMGIHGFLGSFWTGLVLNEFRPIKAA